MCSEGSEGLKMLSEESEPSFLNNLSISSDCSSIFFDKYEYNNVFQRHNSLSLKNISFPIAEIDDFHKSINYFDFSVEKLFKNEEYFNKMDIQEVNKNLEMSTKALDEQDRISLNLSAKYSQALQEIEFLQLQIKKLKSKRSITPLLVRRKSLQSSLIKSALKRTPQNLTKSSLFEADSTCMTIDIENGSTPSKTTAINEFLFSNNLSETKEIWSIISEKSNEFGSLAPLIITNENISTPKKRKRDIFLNLIRCPKFLYKLKKNRRNTFKSVPKVVIVTPNVSKTDSGNDSYINLIKLKEIQSNQDLCHNMLKLAEELSDKLNTFKCLLKNVE